MKKTRKKVGLFLLGLCTFSFVSATESNTQKVDWGNNVIQSKKLWEQGITGEHINIAVIDSGTDAEHEDLQGSVAESWVCIDNEECKDDKPSEGNHTYFDLHGTHVSGIITANDNNIGTKGIAYNSKIYSYRTQSENSSTAQNIVNALKHIYEKNEKSFNDKKISIVNISQEITNYKKMDEKEKEILENSLKQYNEYVDKLQKQGVLIVIASGNNFLQPYEGEVCTEKMNPKECHEVVLKKWVEILKEYEKDKSLFPKNNITNLLSRSDNVISVGNVFEGSNAVFRFKTSATGPTLDVVAPGTDIRSTCPITEERCSKNEEKLEKGYLTETGTSMAAPYTAGLLALYKELLPHYDNKQLTELLYKTAKPIDYGYVDSNKVNWEYGRGLVQAVFPQEAYTGIMDETLGRVIENKDVTSRTSFTTLFDNTPDDYYYNLTTFKPNSYLKYSFEGKATNIRGTLLQIGKTFKDNTKLDRAKFTIEFLDKNMDVIEGSKRNITSTGWLVFDEPVKGDIYGFKLNNETNNELYIGEFDVTGNFDTNSVSPQIFTSYLPLKEVTLKFYDVHSTKSNFTSKTFSGTHYLKMKNGYQFDYTNIRHAWYQLADDEENRSLGIANKWFQSSEAKLEGIFKYGLMDQVYGRTIDTGDNSRFWYAIDNKTSYDPVLNASFKDNKVSSYGFEKSVSINSLFINVNAKTETDKLQPIITFYDSLGNKIGSEILLIKQHMFNKYISFSQSYENVSKVTIQNNSSNEWIVDEIEFYGDFTEITKPFSFLTSFYFLQDTIKSLYEQPSEYGPLFQRIKILEQEELFASEVAGYNEKTRTFDWYKIQLPNQINFTQELDVIEKWMKLNENEAAPGRYDTPTTSMKPLYKNGITDSIKTIYKTSKSATRVDSLFDNDSYDTGISTGGYVEYVFSQPVSIKTVYLKEVYSRPIKMKLELLDENGNVIYTYLPNQQDMFDRYFNISNSGIIANGFRLTNTETPNYATIEEMEFFQ